MKILHLFTAFTFVGIGLVQADTIWLEELDVSQTQQGYGNPQKGKSVDGHTLAIGGATFQHGLGTHAVSVLQITLAGGTNSFSAKVGVDDEILNSPVASIEFQVIGDKKLLWQSGVMRAGQPAKDCQVDLKGVQNLVLEVTDAGDGNGYDHADWVDVRFDYDKIKPIVHQRPIPPPPYILTPAAPATPRINGANIFGVRPDSPFLFTIPATGDRPMTFSIENLPPGLTLDSSTGQITGSMDRRGAYVVTFIAKNDKGESQKRFRIVCGDKIALTPPMGWNSWNCFASSVNENDVKSAADTMVKSGLINHGWTYINVDDFWQNHKRDTGDQALLGPVRDDSGVIVPNSRFPDMQGLADHIHSLGLKAGLYSSPGEWTCGGCAGSLLHEKQDAETYARWGFDYIKYDWCSYGAVADGKQAGTDAYPRNRPDTFASYVYPYKIMGNYLRDQKRDIVFSLCQYGMAAVWKWGGAVQGNCWRTTGDITDTWESMSGIGFGQNDCAPYANPGNWNDPDMLIVGQVGWGNVHPTRLTADEQYTHISLWCLLSAPLLIGCDMTRLDEFTLNLLENDEVLAVDQDALGKEAMCVIEEKTFRVYRKEMEDGSIVVGFFNLDTEPLARNFIDFQFVGLSGKKSVRDLWRQRDLAEIDTDIGSLPLKIPAHGVLLFRFK